MRPHAIRRCLFTFALLLTARPVFAVNAGALPATTTDAMAQAASPQAIAEYRYLLKQYQEARAEFEQQAGAYWSAISDKRRGRNAKRRDHQPIGADDYVLTQPPVYTGPKRPVNPAPEPEPEHPPREPADIRRTCGDIRRSPAAKRPAPWRRRLRQATCPPRRRRPAARSGAART